MSVERLNLLAVVGMVAFLNAPVSAQSPVVWRSARPASSAKASPAPSPIVSLGRPVALPLRPTATVVLPRPAGSVVRAQAPEFVPPPPGGGSSRQAPPPTADPLLGSLTPAAAGDSGVTTPLEGPIPDPPSATYNDRDRDPGDTIPVGIGLAPPTPHTVSQPPEVPPPSAPFPPPPSEPSAGVFTDSPVAPSFWEKSKDLFVMGDKGNANGQHCLGSDTCFSGLISPVTMPFYFEDPRSLTEIRPIFMYQSIPKNNPVFRGGDALWFGSQSRIAFNEHFSVVLHEMGFLSLQPENPAPGVKSSTGFSELRIGPKYTFLRCTDTGTVAAAGVIFEIPVGSKDVFQNTGTLSVDPYLTIGQTFGSLPGGYGSLNAVGTTGFSLSVDNKRSEFYYLNLHLDYNIANTNLIYPLVEMNWIHYMKGGSIGSFGAEGADLINFGSTTRQGDDYLSLAGGLRWRIADNVWMGGAAEFPITKEKGFNDYRLTFDFIIRF